MHAKIAATIFRTLRGPRRVAFEVDEGNRRDILGTPTFFVEGKTYTGSVPPWLLGRLENAAADVDGGAKSPWHMTATGPLALPTAVSAA